MNLARELVPIPIELDRGEARSVFSFLQGELLEDVPEHSGAAAEALAKISSVVFKSPGNINTDGTISPFSFGEVKGFAIGNLLRNTASDYHREIK